MRDPILPAAMLCFTAGLMIGFRPVRQQGLATIAALASGAVAGLADWSPDWAFSAAWIAILTAAMGVWLGRRVPLALTVAIAMSAGCIAVMLPPGLSGFAVLLVLPLGSAITTFAAARGRELPIKIVAGWLIATAALNAALSVLPVTPGYLPDHLE